MKEGLLNSWGKVYFLCSLNQEKDIKIVCCERRRRKTSASQIRIRTHEPPITGQMFYHLAKRTGSEPGHIHCNRFVYLLVIGEFLALGFPENLSHKLPTIILLPGRCSNRYMFQPCSRIKGATSRYFESFFATFKIIFNLKENAKYGIGKTEKHQRGNNKLRRDRDGRLRMEKIETDCK